MKGKLFLQTASKDGKSRTLLCLDASNGKTIWKKNEPGEPASPKKIHNKNSLASSTPACDGEQVYCVWWDGSAVSLKAYDMTGQEKWRASLGGWDSQHGPGSSPILHGGLVFVNVDDDERAELVAFDARTGEKKWIANRKHERACYTTPYILQRGDKPAELILGTTHLITSYDPATGAINWEYQLTWPKGQMPLRVIGHPVYAAGLLVMSCGDGSGAALHGRDRSREADADQGLGPESWLVAVRALHVGEGQPSLLDRRQAGRLGLLRGSQNRQGTLHGEDHR